MVLLNFPSAARAEYSIMSEQGSIYEPPYASALHETFAWHAAKYFEDRVSLRCEVAAQAGRETVTIDFVATIAGRKIGLWCDDNERYDINARLRRDSRLLAEGAVDAIYHLRSDDLAAHLEDCFYLLAQRAPELFSARGLCLLERLVSDEARHCENGALFYGNVDESDESSGYLQIVALAPPRLPQLRFASA